MGEAEKTGPLHYPDPLSPTRLDLSPYLPHLPIPLLTHSDSSAVSTFEEENLDVEPTG
jgi:hypothetical protein